VVWRASVEASEALKTKKLVSLATTRPFAEPNLFA
jgi:hypothetical protein